MKKFRNNRVISIKFYDKNANIYERMNYCKKQEIGLNFRVVTKNTNDISKCLRRKYIMYLITGMKAFNGNYYKTRNIIREAEAIPNYLNRLQYLCHNIIPISIINKRR